MYITDIETRPRTDLVRRFIKPFPAFDAAEVKYGNAKDPAKRAEILANASTKYEDDKREYWVKAEERAALNPLTAEIVVIGVHDTEAGETRLLSGTETELLTAFWQLFDDHSNAVEQFVYWSGNGSSNVGFDPNMIIRRSWINGVKVSARALNGRYLASRWVDAAARYLLFVREAYCSLTDAADQLGLYTTDKGIPEIFPKSDSDRVRGENFWRYWDGKVDGETPEQSRAMATKYLINDLLTLKAIAGRIL